MQTSVAEMQHSVEEAEQKVATSLVRLDLITYDVPPPETDCLYVGLSSPYGILRGCDRLA